MAPMIDMVFLLLVFFMTVSTLAKEARPETPLPVSKSAVVPTAAPPREIISLLGKDDEYQLFWYNHPIERQALPDLLERSASQGGTAEVLLRGGPDVPWEEWKPVLDILRRAGAGEITFATFED